MLSGGACGTAMVHKEEHPKRMDGAHSVGIVAPNVHGWCTFGGYCSTHRDGASWHAMAHMSKHHNTLVVGPFAGIVAPIK